MSTPSRTRKPPETRASEIRAAAAELARDQGLAALTLRSVAERAGVTPALVAHYSDGMDDLVAQAFSDVVGGELAEVRAQDDGLPAQRLARVFVGILDRRDITLVWLEGWAHARHNRALSAAIDTQMSAWQRAIASIIEDGCRAGEFTTDDPDAVAGQLLAMIDGLAAHALARGTDPAPFVERLARASEVLVGAVPGSIHEA